MIDVLQSVAYYLQNTLTLDPLTRADQAENPNLALRVDCTPIASLVTAGSLQVVRDGHETSTSDTVTCGVSGGALWIGLSWPSAQQIDTLRLWGGQTTGAPVYKVQTSSNGTAWTDASDWTYALAQSYGATIVRLPQSVSAKYVRLLYVSGSPSTTLVCTELQAYGVGALLLPPSDWPTTLDPTWAGRVLVLHPSVQLDAPDPTLSLITVHGEQVQRNDPALGADALDEDTTVWVSVFAPSEGDTRPADTVQRLGRWARRLLGMALATDPAGATAPGIPLLGYQVPLQRLVVDATSNGAHSGTSQTWWTSTQRDWYATDNYTNGPSVLVNGADASPSAIDYARGRVQVTANPTDDVRATFQCGVWEFDWMEDMAGLPSGVEWVRDRHSVQYRLQSHTTRRAVWNAIA